MTDVLGFALERAAQALRQEGYAVEDAQTSSKKGVAGGEPRVVRQQLLPPEEGEKPRVRLTYALFRTELECE